MGQDVWQNTWNVWWVHRALLVEHTNPYTTTMLFYPQGASLYLHSLILPLGIMGIPLMTLTGSIIPTYNILTLLVVMLSGYGSFLLIRYLTGHAPAALVGGAMVLCSPQRLFELRGAQMATLNDYAVPLAVLALLLTLERRSWRMASLTALLLLLNGLNKWYHLFHVLLILALLLAWRGVQAWRQGKRSALWYELQPWLRVGAVTTLVLVPFLLPAVLEALTTSYALKSDELVISADLLHMLPNTIGGVWQQVPLEWWYSHLYSFVPLVLALVGIALAPRQTALWATIGGVLVLLSFGPQLRIGNSDTGIPMPYGLFRMLPIFDIFRAPVRMNLVATLMFGIVAAFGLRHMAQRLPIALAWGGALLLVVLIAGETFRLPFPLVDGRVSPFYAQVAQEQGKWSMLELPFDRPDREVLEMYQQTHHGKDILTGRPARSLPGLPYRFAPPIVSADNADLRPDIVSMSSAARDQLLRGLRVRYLIVRPGDAVAPFSGVGQPGKSHHGDTETRSAMESGQEIPDSNAETQRRRDAEIRATNGDGQGMVWRGDQQVAVAEQMLGSLTLAYEDETLQAYRLDKVAAWLDDPGSTTTEDVPLFLGLDWQWEPRETSGYGVMRWLPQDGAGVWAYTPDSRRVLLDVALYSVAGAGALEVWLNGEHVQTIPIAAGTVLRRYTVPLQLPAGRSHITFHTPLEGVQLGGDTRRLTLSVHEIVVR
jgi:hypothetical protein